MIDFKTTEKDIKEHKDEIIDKLIGFSGTDVLLFWSGNEELKKKQNEQWSPILSWIKEYFNMNFQKTETLTPPPENEKYRHYFIDLLHKMSIKDLTSFYLAAVRMKSPLLALALVKKKIDASEAFNLAYLEELHQNKIWGEEEEAVKRRQPIQKELREIEKYMKK